jgi:FAD/FMN-containing dehydrogenase
MRSSRSRREVLGSLSALGTAALANGALARTGVPPAPNLTPRAPKALASKIFFKADKDYEAARRACVWNAIKPERYPGAIVMAESDADVIAAVRFAKSNGLKVGVRSTGHSWVAPYLRDDAVVINLSGMQDVAIDTASGSVSCRPAVQGQHLGMLLREQQLMFPTGHCYGVGLGGYVLSGGHGWNSRLWGPACASLKAVDVVTADGDLIRADATQNADYFWAARGAGPGFFGVATRLHLQAYPLPTVMRMSRYVFAIDALEELFTWVRDHMDTFPRILEVLILASAPEGVPQIRITAVALGYSEDEVAAALAVIDNAPFVRKATAKSLNNHVVLPAQEESPTAQEPHGARIVMDGMWTNASAEEIVPHLRSVFTQYPTPQSFFMWQCWGPVRSIPDMAYSIQADVYLSCGAVYRDTADDELCGNWVTRSLQQLNHLAVGSMMNDERMIARPAKYLSGSAQRRLERLRQRLDPHNRFVSYLTT